MRSAGVRSRGRLVSVWWVVSVVLSFMWMVGLVLSFTAVEADGQDLDTEVAGGLMDFDPVPASFYEGLQFDMREVPLPSIPDYEVSITEFGALGDGETLNTQAFERAIDHVTERGGGRVVVPKGIWLTGPLILQSNLNLHLERGAIVLFSDDFDHYPLIETSFEGLETYRALSPIYGRGLENVAITGEGVFDGSGEAWRPLDRAEVTERMWQERIASGGILSEDGETWYPSESSMRGDPGNFNVPLDRTTRKEFEEVKDFLRPVMVSIRESRNVLLDGPTFQNSPAWMLHPLMSENVILRNLTILNPTWARNGDGLDLESTRNAVIYDNRFDVGDDAICIKSGKNEDGRRRGMPTENVIIRQNTVYQAHGGFVIGSEMSGGVRNVQVTDNLFMGTDVGIRFKSTRGRGGVVENIFISDIDMKDIVTEPVRINLYYGGEAPSPDQKAEVVDQKKASEKLPPVSEETPRFRNIHITDILCRGARTAMWIQGLPEMPVENVTISNARITSERGALVTDIEGFTLENTAITVDDGPVVYLQDARGTTLRNMALAYSEDAQPGVGVSISGPLAERIRLVGVSFDRVAEPILTGTDVADRAVVRE